MPPRQRQPKRAAATAAAQAALAMTDSMSDSPPVQTPSTRSNSSSRSDAPRSVDQDTKRKRAASDQGQGKKKKAMSSEPADVVVTAKTTAKPATATLPPFMTLADKLAARPGMSGAKRNLPSPAKRGPFSPFVSHTAASASASASPTNEAKVKSAPKPRGRPPKKPKMDETTTLPAPPPWETPKTQSLYTGAGSTTIRAKVPRGRDILTPPPGRAREILTPPPGHASTSRRLPSSSPLSSLPDTDTEDELDEKTRAACSEFNALPQRLLGDDWPVDTDSTGEESGQGSPAKTHVRTKMPPEVFAGDTCLFHYYSSWFLARFLRLDASPESALKDVYVLKVENVGVKHAPRSKIIFLHEPEVKTVKRVGGWPQRPKDLPIIVSDARRRVTTPPLPASDVRMQQTIAPEQFAQLSRQDQIYRIRPHLLRVIREEYAPALPRIETFFSRSGPDPDLDYELGPHAHEVPKCIRPEIDRWARRGERELNGDPDQPPRPTGSAAYEALVPVRRAAYVRDVLIPETIRRIEILSRVPQAEVDRQEQDQEHEQKLYDEARERLEAAYEDDEPWEEARIEAEMAIGQYDKPIDEEEAQLRRVENGTAVMGSAGGRIMPKVNYRV